MSADAVQERRNHVLPILRESWPALPVLLVVGVVCCAIAAVTAYELPGATPVGVLVLGLVIVPLISTLVQFMQDAIGPDAYGFAGYLRRFPRAALRAAGVSAVASVLAAMTVVALGAWDATGNLFWLLPLGVGGASTVLTVLAMIVAVPLRLAAPDLAVRELWALSFTVVARAPIPVVAVVAVGVVGVWACLSFSAALIIVVPPMLAVVWAAGSLTSCEQAGLTLTPEEDAPAGQ